MFVLEGLVLVLTCLLICYNPRDSTEDILIKTGTIVRHHGDQAPEDGKMEEGGGGGGGGLNSANPKGEIGLSGPEAVGVTERYCCCFCCCCCLCCCCCCCC